jgi:hypothetical protein
LGDDEKDEQQSDVLDGCGSRGFGLKSWTRSAKKSCQQLAIIRPTQHDIQCHNDPQMSLDYHLVD